LETIEIFGPRASDGRAIPVGDIACAQELAREGYETWMHRVSDEGAAWKA
jgi:hypothetical protein